MSIPEDNEEDDDVIDPPKGVYNSLTEPANTKKPTIFSFGNNNNNNNNSSSSSSKKNVFTNFNKFKNFLTKSPLTEPKNTTNFQSNGGGGNLDVVDNSNKPTSSTTNTTNSSTARANFFSSMASANRNYPDNKSRNYADIEVFEGDDDEEDEDDHRKRNSVELIPLKKPQETPEQQCNKVNSSRNSNSSNSSSDNNSKNNKNSLTSQSILQAIKQPEDCNSKQF